MHTSSILLFKYFSIFSSFQIDVQCLDHIFKFHITISNFLNLYWVYKWNSYIGHNGFLISFYMETQHIGSTPLPPYNGYLKKC